MRNNSFCWVSPNLHTFTLKPSPSAKIRSNLTRLRLVVLIPFINLKDTTQVISCKFGEEGIRTLGGVSPAATFEIATFNHSDTSPFTLFYHENFMTYKLYLCGEISSFRSHNHPLSDLYL